jgi:TPP-dependent pyruvate/acetoin dehydrogenase alpha subunit
MDTGKETETTFENPLIPNARLRQIYLAMLRMRLLEKAIAPKRRGALGLEACLASTSVDLGPLDLISDTLAGGGVEFLRGATLEQALRPHEKAGKRRLKADCGTARQLPVGLGVQERVWAAMGAAAALKAAHAVSRIEAKVESDMPPQQTGLVVVYTKAGEIPPAGWRKMLAFASVQELPVLFVVLPAEGNKKPRTIAPISAIALQHGIPGIPVDADDPVAIYRVAQEAIGRARIGGGSALMECIPVAGDGAKGKRADAIAVLEKYMLGRGVIPASWLERESKAMARRTGR